MTADRTSPETPAGATTATLLVVDDDLSLLRLAERMLHSAGYVVHTAGSAEAAWPLIHAHPEIDLLLADVVLPGMNGVQLVDRVLALRPRIRVLYMSGYADEGLGAVELKAVEGQLLRKPFTSTQVVSMVRAAIDGGGGETPGPKPPRRV